MKLLAPATVVLLLASAATVQATVIRPEIGGQHRAGTSIQRIAYDARVERAQRRLNELGYDAGPSDGLMGSRTRAAIRAYQREQRLTASGELDRQTMRSLRGEAAREDRRKPDAAQPAPTASNRLIVDTQAELRRRGYPVPVVNGTLDADTREAIRAFQRDQNLLVTGEASAPLLERIKSVPVPDSTAGAQRDLVRDIQSELNARGYAAGEPNGVMDRRLRDAIRTYQADAGLKVDGDADAEVLESLRRPGPLAAKPKETNLLEDSFDNGNHTDPVAWQVLQGEFSVRDGALRSSVVRSATRQESSPEDLARELLKGILGSAVGVSNDQGGKIAAIASQLRIPNQFRIKTFVSMSASEAARLTIGPYQSNANNGYRLVLGRDGPQILAVLEGAEVRLVAQAKGASGLDDGKFHEVEWRRDAAGWMTVFVDSRRVIETRDAGFTQPFDGLAIANGEGTWAVDQIYVLGTEEG